MDNQELWKEHHGDTKSAINDELAVFAASNWKSRRTRRRHNEIQLQNLNSNADMLALNAAKLQNTLALFNDAKEKDKRNAEIDIVAKAARSKTILRQLSHTKYALQSSRMSRYRAGKVVAKRFKRLKEWKAHELGISDVLSIPRSEIMFSAGLDCKASIWDPVRGTKIGLLQGGLIEIGDFLEKIVSAYIDKNLNSVFRKSLQLVKTIKLCQWSTKAKISQIKETQRLF